MSDSGMDVRILVDLVLVVFVIEVAALALFGTRFPRLPPLRTMAPNLAAGLFLVMALRCAVRQDGAVAIAAFLALGGVAHVLDLRARIRR